MRRLWLIGLLALGGCDDGDGGGDPTGFGGGGGASGSGGASRTTGLPESTGDADADRFIRAAVACGPQSPDTVPAGWQRVATGELGCTFMAPPGWTVNGAGQNITSVGEGAAELTGYVSMGGADATGLITCTPRGVADWAAGLLAQGGPCEGLEPLWYREGVDNVAGLAIPKSDYVFTCTKAGTLELAYLWASVQGTTPLCTVVVFGLWMPAAEIDAKVCTLTQVLNSYRCPRGSEPCEAGPCDDWCRQNQAGATGGVCLPDGVCRCTT